MLQLPFKSNFKLGVMIVGNIKGHTRVITTTISMMNSMGDYPMAAALGIILLIISFNK